MTTELFSKGLLNKILASIPEDFEKSLIVKKNEPNTLQLLKLSILALFNNILYSPFLDRYGNSELKALWLLKNIECAQKVFAQYNFLDYYPYVENGRYIEPFFSTRMHIGHVVKQWDILLLWLPSLLSVLSTYKNVRKILKQELVFSLAQIVNREKNLEKTFNGLAVNLLFSIGEYNSTMDKFVDMFLPIDRDEENPINMQKELARNVDNTRENPPIFSDKTICLLSRSRDGGKVLTILSELDKKSTGRFNA